MSTANRIRQLFDHIAPQYDVLNDGLSFGLHRVWKQMTVDWSGAGWGDRALDVCCGSGDLTRRLARAVGPGGTVVGADFSPQMLSQARSREESPTSHTQAQAATIEWIEADALALPVADGSFDAVTMGYGLRNVVDRPRALAELRRVLRPGGRAAILDFHRPTGAIARQFQTLYLQGLVVPVARQLGLGDDYAYLVPSLAGFPSGQEQVALARAAGFDPATHYAIAGGMMGVLVAVVPGA